ncbi:MAG: hypothetical protein V1887_01580 [Candidatus Aenigmatarchaeota archaeon]
MQKFKAMFALTAVVALAGVMFATAGFAAAEASKFQTLRASEAVWIEATHVCNENYGGVGASCYIDVGACYSKASAIYSDDHLWCTNQAYTDCGNGNNGNWDQNSQICYCDETFNEC